MFKAKLAVIAIALLICIQANATADEVFHPNPTTYDGVGKEFVKDGLVDYAGLKENPESLNQYLADLSRIEQQAFGEWDKNQQLAYLINLYNAATLALIVDHYPVQSIKDIGSFFKGPWSQPVVKLFGDTITLNTLEHTIIRTNYNEPRIHLALVCAAKGCPPLRSEAYTAEKLDAQLDDQALLFLSNPIKFRIDRPENTVYLSPIFKWYGNDFIGTFTPATGFDGFDKMKRAVLHFCSRYLSDPDSQYLAADGYSVSYLDYDWSLNDRKAKK